MKNERFTITQRQRVFQAFNGIPRTMLQVSHSTGVERANICRLIDKFRDSGTVYPVRRGLCPITKARATFYTTNPATAWTYFISKTKTAWEGLPEEQVSAVWSLIQSHVLNHYNGPTIPVPVEVRDVWENTVLPTIAREGVL